MNRKIHITIRRLNRHDKTQRLKRPYITKLGQFLRDNQISDTSRLRGLKNG